MIESCRRAGVDHQPADVDPLPPQPAGDRHAEAVVAHAADVGRPPPETRQPDGHVGLGPGHMAGEAGHLRERAGSVGDE